MCNSIARSLLVGVLCLALWPAATHAQSEALMEAYHQGQTLYEAGRYEQAIPLWRKALELVEREFGLDHPTTATLLNNLAELYSAQGRYAEAEPLYQRALAVWEKALGPNDPLGATSLNNLAGLYHALARYGEVEPLYQRALAIREKALGPDHPDVAQSLNDLAGFYRTQRRYANSEPLYKRALTIYETTLGPGHPDTAMALETYVGFLRETACPTLDEDGLAEVAKWLALGVSDDNIGYLFKITPECAKKWREAVER